jgi:5-methyltetrahydrofolate--homocysteine methyltransferase
MVLHARRTGIEDALDASGVREEPVRVLNEVLLPAMKEVGDKFGSGELILPFVLQSAEVMKRAVRHLEQFLEKAEGTRRGRWCWHRVRRRARHRQVAREHDPLEQRLHGRGPRQAGAGEHDPGEGGRGEGRRDRALGAARLDEQADAALRAGARPPRHGDPGAHRRRRDQPALRAARPLVDGERPYESGVFYCKDAFEGLETMDVLQDPARRGPFVQGNLDAARNDVFLHTTVGKETLGGDAGGERSEVRSDVPVPGAPFFGARVLHDIRSRRCCRCSTSTSCSGCSGAGAGRGPSTRPP